MDSSQKWGVDRLIANKGKVSFTIPNCIAAGQYLLRVELIGMSISSIGLLFVRMFTRYTF